MKHIENLVKMANDIGSFFAAEPDHQLAIHSIADHLKRFWEPRMRRALLAHIDTTGGEGLDPIVQAAVARHRDKVAVAQVAA